MQKEVNDYKNQYQNVEYESKPIVKDLNYEFEDNNYSMTNNQNINNNS